MTQPRLSKPRCFLLIAHAPAGTKPADANRIFNEYVADPKLPLVLFHDHFIGQLGGVAIFYAESQADRDVLYAPRVLRDWEVEIRPLIYSHSPAAFDEQIAYTLRAYRSEDWAQLRTLARPTYGSPTLEAETGIEQSSSEGAS